ncbi:hypothetical protein GFL85_10540 [Rhizobium laguerreae]|uniref:hypothetical protein n=1 Tax=Rhizobium laguerreae TaxID=1076926 RepID=UPI00143F5F35|nr:hypothetical protein [Rhizobium laguerreae]NKM11469.1 hypothetical protein [Rhizobium laguerreae]
MFEKALVRKVATAQVDIGLLAETLLFYQQTHLILDRSTAVSVIRQIGIDNLWRLAKDGHAQFSYFSNTLGVITENANGVPLFSFAGIRQTGHRDKPSVKWDREHELRVVLERKDFEPNDARRLSKEMLRLAPVEKLVMSGQKIDLNKMANDDVLDSRYIDLAARFALEAKLDGRMQIPNHWKFAAHMASDANRFYIETNYNFDLINRNLVPIPEAPLSAADLLAEIFEARADMVFASKHMSEIVTSPTRARMLQGKFDLMNMRRETSQRDLEMFQNVHFESKNLRGAINSGERSFAEFLDLLDESRKFKEWLRGAVPEKGLLKEYHDAVTKRGWLDRLPSKGIRFGLMTGGGVLLDLALTGGLATVGGAAFGAADTFLIDKMLRGWRPNQFVEEDLQIFVDGS